jgi:two-component system LytT family response regulator
VKDQWDVRIIGEARNADEAERMINTSVRTWCSSTFKCREDPASTSLPVCEDPPSVIFVTAYDQYAIRAFEVNALDYLLKPIEPERLKNA